jgi:hypothetical protein
MLIQPVHPDHPSTNRDRDREPNVMAGPKPRGKAGAMPNRVRIIPPVLKPVVWLDHDRRQRLSYNIAMKENQVIYA